MSGASKSEVPSRFRDCASPCKTWTPAPNTRLINLLKPRQLSNEETQNTSNCSQKRQITSHSSASTLSYAASGISHSHFVVSSEGLGLTASIAAPDLFFGKGVLLLMYIDDTMAISDGKTLKQISTKLYERGPTPADRFQYLGMEITRDRHHRQIDVNQQGYLE